MVTQSRVHLRQRTSLEEEEAEEDSDARLRLMVDHVRDLAIFMLDVDGNVASWNRGAQLAKGYTRCEILGRHISTFYTRADREVGCPQALLARAARDGHAADEGWRIRKDGSRFWADVVITALRDEDGELCGFGKVTRDLTERKSLDEARIRAIRAQEGLRLRDEFLSLVSHELKTPLAGLLLQIDALANRNTLDDHTRSKLLRARESGERLDDLIETLVDVSHIATGRLVLMPERFDLVALVHETVASFQRSAARAGCELRFDAPDEIVGSWDRERMRQLIAYLMSNAIKYGAGRPVEVCLEQRGHDVALVVRDHGPGIDPTMQSRIFERFERAVSTRHYGGLGVGLYAVHEIVTAHGGIVTVRNAESGGARFTIQLALEA